jgi:hypothetical protein
LYGEDFFKVVLKIAQRGKNDKRNENRMLEGRCR